MQLPKNTHPHDKIWLISQIQQLPARLRPTAIKGYDAAYTEAHIAEKNRARKRKRSPPRRQHEAAAIRSKSYKLSLIHNFLF